MRWAACRCAADAYELSDSACGKMMRWAVPEGAVDCELRWRDLLSAVQSERAATWGDAWGCEDVASAICADGDVERRHSHHLAGTLSAGPLWEQIPIAKSYVKVAGVEVPRKRGGKTGRGTGMVQTGTIQVGE